MTDLEIIQALIERDERVTQDFFFRRCQPLINSLIEKHFKSDADYDELVNELYCYLMENDAYRLRQFGGRSSIFYWLKRVAEHFFEERKRSGVLIPNQSHEQLLDNVSDILGDVHEESGPEMDVAAILDQIDNENYRMVLQKHVIEGMDYDELEKITGIKKANLYNIKKRALKAVEKIARIARTHGDALCAVFCEQYILHRFGIHRSLQELQELAMSHGWLSEEGALVKDLGNTAAWFGLKVNKIASADLGQICDAIDAGDQVIAAVDGGELIGDPVEERLEDVFAGGIVDHCVVVLSVDIKHDQVALYDPAFGVVPLTVSIAHFLDAWADSDFYCVVVG